MSHKLNPEQPGKSPLHPITAPRELVAQVRACLKPGETLSGITRELWVKWVKQRQKDQKTERP